MTTTDAEYGALVERHQAILKRRGMNSRPHALEHATVTASAIEALIRERDATNERLTAAVDDFNDARKSADDMMAFWETVHKASEARIAELEAGLRPFAGYDVRAISAEVDGYVMHLAYGDQQPMFTDFDRARALLSAEARDDVS